MLDMNKINVVKKHKSKLINGAIIVAMLVAGVGMGEAISGGASNSEVEAINTEIATLQTNLDENTSKSGELASELSTKSAELETAKKSLEELKTN